IDQVQRDLVRADPQCVAIIQPYQRGQDIERWWSPPSGLHMIALKSSSDQAWPWSDAHDEAEAARRFRATYPSLHAHMKKFEEVVDPTGKRRGLRHREDHGRFWWELRSCAYYEAFKNPKIQYQEIQYHPRFNLDLTGCLSNNKAFFLPTDDPWL